jgi:hypothetical protein
MVPLIGVTHPMKEEKLGLLRGVVARWKMYWDIFKLILSAQKSGALDSATRQASSTGARSEDVFRR